MTNATFTLPLKSVIALTGGSAPVVNGIRVYAPGADGIGLEHYPLFDESYRVTLNGKIVDHYWNREIGRETVDDFQRALRMTLNEVMPYWNQLYKSEQLEFDPLKTVDLRTIGSAINHNARAGTTTADADTTSGNTSTNTATAASRAVQSETPQAMLSGSKDYASSAADSNSQTSSGSTDTATATSSQTGTESVQDDGTQSTDSSVTGFQAIPSDLLMRYRESLLNIDRAILAELEPLFMGIWNNGDEFAGNGYY